MKKVNFLDIKCVEQLVSSQWTQSFIGDWIIRTQNDWINPLMDS